MKTLKSKLTAEPSLTEKRLEPTEKILYFKRQRSHHNKKSGEVHLQYKQIPHPVDRQPTNWEIIISQKFFPKSESRAPCQAQPEGLAIGGTIPKAFGFQGQWGFSVYQKD